MQPLAPASAPLEVAAAAGAPVLRTYTGDFTGDGIGDYVVLVADTSPPGLTGERPTGRECWITSAGRLLRCSVVWYADHDYRWFIDLTGDGIPEVIRAHGFSDGIDYTVSRLDTLTGQQEDLFYFNPILIAATGRRYWGYPWDVLNLPLRRRPDGSIEVQATFDYRFDGEELIESPDNQGLPDWQRRIPVLAFVGVTTQPWSVVSTDEVPSLAWLTLEELIQESRRAGAVRLREDLP